MLEGSLKEVKENQLVSKEKNSLPGFSPEHSAYKELIEEYVEGDCFKGLLKKRDLWDKMRALPLPPSLRKAMFSCAANEGIGSALSMLRTICVEEKVHLKQKVDIQKSSLDGSIKVRIRNKKDYYFGQKTLRFTKYQIFVLYRKHWLKKGLKRDRFQKNGTYVA